MSHYLTYVLIPEKTKKIWKAVRKLLKPYDENVVVEEYQEICPCILHQVLNQAEIPIPKPLKPAVLDHGDGQTFLVLLPKDLDAYTTGWKLFVERYGDSWFSNTSFLEIYKTSPDCIRCGGTGLIRSQFNPRGKWDWRITGQKSRFHGVLCVTRDKGSQKDKLSDVVPVRHLNVKELPLPDAILTPDGQWHEQVYAPFVGCAVIDEREWRQTWETILEKHSDAILVAVDCHT
jgi:hypothetical protein